MRELKSFGLIAAGACALWPAVARADAGIPMIVLVWPASWVLFFPVVLVEALVGHRLLKLPFPRALKAALIANLVSTLIGIPLTWAAAVVPEMVLAILFSEFGSGSAVGDAIGKWLTPVLSAPWLSPGAQEWMVPFAVMVLCVPFFFASVYSEFWVARRLLREMPSDEVKRWSWRSNAITYAAILVVVAGLLLIEIRKHR